MMTIPTTDLPRRLFDVDEFERMAAAGVFDDDDVRVELILGEVITMTPPPNPPHEGMVNGLNHLLMTRLGKQCIVHVQNTLRVDRHCQFTPDLTLLRWQDDFYRGRRPLAEDALLVVEVSDSSLRKDVDVKVPLYARAGIPEVWVIDVKGRAIHRFWLPADDPADGDYAESRAYSRDEQIPLPADGGLALVRDIVG